jgi:hypothetical protein
VRGATYIGSGLTATGTMLSVNQNAPNQNGLDVFLTSSSSTITGVGINTIVNNPNRIAINVYDEQNQSNMLSIYGDGRILIQHQTDQNSSIEVKNQNNNSVFEVSGNGNVNIKNKAKLIFDGSQPNWNTWQSAICAPMGAAWVTSEPEPNGFYTGLGMTTTGLYYGRSENEIGSQNTNIQYLFAVNLEGKIVARAIKIYDFGWADYVFDQDYVLRNLSEVELFIQKNGHLPDVPSEDELKEEGLDLGKMQEIQMSKIEELTLYIIDLEKRILELEVSDK